MAQHHSRDPMHTPITSTESSPSMPPVPDDAARRRSPVPDTVVRAASPFGRRYLKPINGIQTKGFARSAQRRSSVVTLGSIERLQYFYAKKDLKVNKTGTLGFGAAPVVEEHHASNEESDDDLDQLPEPQPLPPSWADLDVETDLDVLLSQCYRDIQSTLQTWAIVTGPQSKHSQDDSDSDGAFQILPLLHSVTKMLNSVRNYTMYRHDLRDSARNELRHASLQMLAALKDLENAYRVDEDEDSQSEDGYIYRNSEFNRLEKERHAIHKYLTAVERYAFNPPHHIGSPPAVFTPEIKALMVQTSMVSADETEQATFHTTSSMPQWLKRGSFANDPMGRYYAMLSDYRNHAADDALVKLDEIPDPHNDEDEFLRFLADGILLCNVYNSIVKRSRRPFGFISKIHQDTRRTYRAIENLRYFAASCKYRFELVFPNYDPGEIARKTDKGLATLKNVVSEFCDCVIHELRDAIETMAQRRSLPACPPLVPEISEYMEKKLFVSQSQDSSTS